MADSVDRVFVHALNTVKKVPKTGAMRPPSTERLRLYGLYKQAMEGDVDGVMERPASVGSNQDEPEDTRKDRQKYDSWDAQRGLSRTEAKRRYVEALIETMHRYASTTADARALVDELEFVWDQIKNNSIISNGSSPRRATSGMEVTDYCAPRHSRYPPPNADENMRVLSPESQDDELERKGERRIWYSEHSEGIYGGEKNDKGRETIEWRRKVEQALMKMTAEVAALKEQTSNVWDHQGKRTKRKDLTNWLAWLWWVAVRHIFVDVVILGMLLLWMRTRKDRRLQNLIKEGLKIGLEFVRQIMPSR